MLGFSYSLRIFEENAMDALQTIRMLSVAGATKSLSQQPSSVSADNAHLWEHKLDSVTVLNFFNSPSSIKLCSVCIFLMCIL